MLRVSSFQESALLYATNVQESWNKSPTKVRERNPGLCGYPPQTRSNQQNSVQLGFRLMSGGYPSGFVAGNPGLLQECGNSSFNLIPSEQRWAQAKHDT